MVLITRVDHDLKNETHNGKYEEQSNTPISIDVLSKDKWSLDYIISNQKFLSPGAR